MTEAQALRNKKIPLIAKLLSLAKSDNENEAKLALEHASQLMEQYNISQAEAMAADPDTVTWDISTHRIFNIPYHMIDMYFNLAVFCDGKGTSNRLVTDPVTLKKQRRAKRRDFTFFGTDSDFLNFQAVIDYAGLFILKMVESSRRNHPFEGVSYHNAYRVGLCDGISSVVNGIVYERRLRYQKQSESTALILTGKAVAIDGMFPSRLGKHGGSSVTSDHGHGMGMAHGKTFSPEGRVSNSKKLLK